MEFLISVIVPVYKVESYLSHCVDSILTQTYQNELHRPMWPYKSKIKISACPNDCVSSQARADISIIGKWRDAIIVDQAEVAKYADAGMDIENLVCGYCPTACCTYDAEKKEIK